jgi:hypothetical protein
MSKNNGDKARFAKEQKKKLLRRKHTLALRQALASPLSTNGQSQPPPPVETLDQSDASPERR